jgi:2-oxoglutarate dehydrogenase C-terminal
MMFRWHLGAASRHRLDRDRYGNGGSPKRLDFGLPSAAMTRWRASALPRRRFQLQASADRSLPRRPPPLDYAGRAASASPATGQMSQHLAQLKAFLDQAYVR